MRGLAHITSGGLGNLLRLAADVGYEIDDPLPVPPIFELIAERGGVSDEEMHEVFNMGCGFCCVVAAERRGARRWSLLRPHYPGAKRIGVAAGARGPALSGIPSTRTPSRPSRRWTAMAARSTSSR